MTCEKQFVPYEDKGIYCSDACRRVDQSSGSQSTMPRTYSSGNYPFYTAGTPEARDIIPPASPSRPNSMLFSNSPPITPDIPNYHSSAVSALRSLNLNGRPPSPPSPAASSGGNFWPFGGGRSAATSPSTSYNRPSAPYLSSTYDTGYSSAYGAGGYSAGHYHLSSGGLSSMDRPLPSRTPSEYARPKSIELVTPMVSR